MIGDDSFSADDILVQAGCTARPCASPWHLPGFVSGAALFLFSRLLQMEYAGEKGVQDVDEVKGGLVLLHCKPDVAMLAEAMAREVRMFRPSSCTDVLNRNPWFRLPLPSRVMINYPPASFRRSAPRFRRCARRLRTWP